MCHCCSEVRPHTATTPAEACRSTLQQGSSSRSAVDVALGAEPTGIGAAELEYTAVGTFNTQPSTGAKTSGGGYGGAASVRTPHSDGAVYFNNGRCKKSGRTYLKCSAALLTNMHGTSTTDPKYWKSKSKGVLGKRTAPSIPPGYAHVELCAGTYDEGKNGSSKHAQWCTLHRQRNRPVRMPAGWLAANI